jgi:hypothetical protein
MMRVEPVWSGAVNVMGNPWDLMGDFIKKGVNHG